MALARRQTNLRTSPSQGWNLANNGASSNPFAEFERLFSELASPNFSQAQWAQGFPVDLYETAEDFVLEMAVPGVHVDDLDISIEGRQLTIGGSLPEAEDQGRRYWLQTIPHGQFSRTVSLPANVEPNNVQATVTNGLLVLTMPKAAEARAHRIAINAG